MWRKVIDIGIKPTVFLLDAPEAVKVVTLLAAIQSASPTRHVTCPASALISSNAAIGTTDLQQCPLLRKRYIPIKASRIGHGFAVNDLFQGLAQQEFFNGQLLLFS